MKKFFAWVMVLTMMLTMMPVLDVHNHAHGSMVKVEARSAEGAVEVTIEGLKLFNGDAEVAIAQ